MTESELVQGCRQSNLQAQQELYARTSHRIYSLILRITHNPDDAFDLTQETYIRVFRTIHQFDGAAAIATWIHRIAVNETLQFLRRRKRYARALKEGVEATEQSCERVGVDDRLDVSEAIGELPESERAMIVLRYFQGLSYTEMAEALDKPAGTIASGLNRARKMLRTRLRRENSKKD